MSKAMLNGSRKLILPLLILVFGVGLAQAATYLPSTKYINIQTEFEQLTITLEKFGRVDMIAHCPGFAAGSCPGWQLYDTSITQNATHVTFNVWHKGAYIGIRMLEEGKLNLTQIKRLLESRARINITQLDMTDKGLYLEFVVPYSLSRNASIMQVLDAVVIISGLRNESLLRNVQRIALDEINYNNEALELKTDVVAIDASGFEQAAIKLPKRGSVNTIMKCNSWDFNSSTCGEWVPTTIPFTQDEDYVYFNVTGFSAYGGVELTILTLQSYPQVGSYWIVRFLAKGTADLTIEGANGTIFGRDIVFDSLKCGDALVEVEELENGVRVPEFSCNTTAYHKVKVLTTGRHVQKFTFGDYVAYAKNLANNLPNTLSVEGKLTNASNHSQNGLFNLTFRIYNASMGGTKLWEEKKNNVNVIDGIFSVILGTSVELDLDFSQPYYLAVMVEGDEEMSPRINLTSVPYSRTADRSFNLSCSKCVTIDMIDTTGSFIIEGTLNMTGNVINMHAHRIINLADPQEDQDAATKKYVDSIVGSEGGWSKTGNLVKLVTPTDTVNITTVFINNTNGRVGIGTYSPTERLTVSGNLHVSGNITSTDYVIKATSNAVVISASNNKRLIFTTNITKWT